jgi:hypothetical protein
MERVFTKRFLFAKVGTHMTMQVLSMLWTERSDGRQFNVSVGQDDTYQASCSFKTEGGCSESTPTAN